MYQLDNIHPSVSVELEKKIKKIKKINHVSDIERYIGSVIGDEVLIEGVEFGREYFIRPDCNVLLNCLYGMSHSVSGGFHLISVKSGDPLHDVVQWAMDNGVFGLENLAGVFCTVGEAVTQNVFAYGVSLSDFVFSVEYVDLRDGERYCLSSEDCRFELRNSIFAKQMVSFAFVTEVKLKLPVCWEPVLLHPSLRELNNPCPIDVFERVMSLHESGLPGARVVNFSNSFLKSCG